MKKTVIIILSALAGTLVLLMLLTFLLVNGNRVAALVEKELGERFTVEINSAVFNPFSRTLRLENISIKQEPDTTIFESGNLFVKQIKLWELIYGNIEAEEVELSNYTLNLRLLNQEHSTESDTSESTNSSKGTITVNSVNLNNGHLLFSDNKGGEGIINGLNVNNASVNYDPTCEICTPLSSVQNLVIYVTDLSYDSPDGRYHFNARDAVLNEEENSLVVQHAKISPVLSQEDFFGSLTYREDMYQIELVNANIYDFNYEALREHEDFKARYMTMDSLAIHVTLDKRVEKRPDPDDKLMPLKALEELAYQVALDSLSVSDADIRYSEIDENGVRPGTVTFADTRATIFNIYNRSDEPLTVIAHSHLEGVGELDAEITMSGQTGVTRIDVSGKLGRFDMSGFNNILVDLEGIRITGGMIDHLDFDFSMNDTHSEGELRMDYSDLSIEMVDRADNNQNLGDQILGRLVNEIVVRGSDRNDSEGAGIGEISAERDPKNSFFNYLWISLKSGLFDIIRRI